MNLLFSCQIGFRRAALSFVALACVLACGGEEEAAGPAYEVPTAPAGYAVYEQTAACAARNPNLKLDKLAVAYPEAAETIDCARNPRNYVMFNVYDEDDSMESSLSVGYFRMDTPSPELYDVSAERAIDALLNAFRGQAASFEDLGAGRVEYGDQSLYSRDFAIQLEGQQEFMVRAAAAPNYASGHGVLVIGTQRVDKDREAALARLGEDGAPYPTALATLRFADE